MPTAYVHRDVNSARSCAIASAAIAGLEAEGWRITYEPTDPVSLVVGYGWGTTMRLLASRHGLERTVYVDMGWWNRKPIYDILSGHHKLALGGRWPTLDVPAMYERQKRLGVLDYAMRFTVLGLTPQLRVPVASRAGKVLVAGMSSKAASTFDLQPLEWERRQIYRLRAAGAKVLYRPKPSWHGRQPIDGAAYHDPDQYPLEDAFSQVHGVATYFGGAAVDALVSGLPFYVETGPLKPWSARTVEDLLTTAPLDLPTRKLLLRELAWHQWSLKEIELGRPFAPGTPIGDAVPS